MIFCKDERVGMVGSFDDIFPEFACIAVAFYEKALKCVIKKPEDASVESTAASLMFDLVKFAVENAGTGEQIEPEEFFNNM